MLFVKSVIQNVERNVGLDARNDIEKDFKNKWVWNWLLEKDVNEVFLSDFVTNCQMLVIRQTERICSRSYMVKIL